MPAKIERKGYPTLASSETMRSQIIDVPTIRNQDPELEERPESPVIPADAIEETKKDADPSDQDAFGNEEFAEVKYKVLKWWYVAKPSISIHSQRAK